MSGLGQLQQSFTSYWMHHSLSPMVLSSPHSLCVKNRYLRLCEKISWQALPDGENSLMDGALNCVVLQGESHPTTSTILAVETTISNPKRLEPMRWLFAVRWPLELLAISFAPLYGILSLRSSSISKVDHQPLLINHNVFAQRSHTTSKMPETPSFRNRWQQWEDSYSPT